MWGLGRIFEEGYKETCYKENRLYQGNKKGAQKEKMRKIDTLKAEERKTMREQDPKMEAGVEEELHLSRKKEKKTIYGRKKPDI